MKTSILKPSKATILHTIKDFFERKYNADITDISEESLAGWCPLCVGPLEDFECPDLCGRVWPELLIKNTFYDEKCCRCPCVVLENSHKELIKKLRRFSLL